jgi:ubiquinone/menaquinone biosynthesis C-methylase UbiE
VDSRARSEIDRIRAAYEARDASARMSSPWRQRAYRLRMQQLEFALLDEFDRAGLEPKGLRVLEVGCGSGYFLSRFLDYGAGHAAGIDLMQDRIALARDRDPRLELVCGDAAALPWPDASFDVITQFTCLSSVLDPGLRRSIATEMWRAVRPGGLILSYDMRSPPPGVRMIRRLASLRRTGARTAQHTATAPVQLQEFRAWFPSAPIRSRSITLAPDLALVAQRSVHLAQSLQDLSFLHTHLLVLAQKGDQSK